MGDIPVALMAYRFRRLVPERSGPNNLERWFGGIEQRAAFKAARPRYSVCLKMRGDVGAG